MRIGVVGLGAVGGLLGARLARAGHRVSAVARGAALDAVRTDGLALESADGAARADVAVSADARDLGVQDLVILAVKTTALPGAAAAVTPLCGEHTAVLSAMNGVPWWFFHGLPGRWQGTRLASTDADGSLTAAIPPARVIGCVVHLSSSMPAPGVVRHRFGNRLIVGEPGGGKTDRLRDVAAALDAAGFATEVTGTIELEIWLKLWGNMTMNPISAITGATADRILADPLVRAFMSAAMEEAGRIGERIGLPIAMTPEERHAVTAEMGAFRTSMLQDAEAGRPIELDALVSAVAEMGRLTGVATPLIDALLGVTRLYARQRGLYPAA
jgi:2-dehydropantoate 2-reductase